jgi:hypothetical protein
MTNKEIQKVLESYEINLKVLNERSIYFEKCIEKLKEGFDLITAKVFPDESGDAYDPCKNFNGTN